jgi:MFS family permease
LLSVVDGMVVWLAVGLAGLVRDGFMAVFMTIIIETEGVGAAYAGTAMGFVTILSAVGSLIAPPLGNSLAHIAPSWPFFLWAVLAGFGVMGLALVKEGGAPVAAKS